jgi:hypothetical protein
MIEFLDQIQYFSVNQSLEPSINSIINRHIQRGVSELKEQLNQIELDSPNDGATLIIQGRLNLAQNIIRDMISFQFAPTSSDLINRQIQSAVDNFYLNL